MFQIMLTHKNLSHIMCRLHGLWQKPKQGLTEKYLFLGNLSKDTKFVTNRQIIHTICGKSELLKESRASFIIPEKFLLYCLCSNLMFKRQHVLLLLLHSDIVRCSLDILLCCLYVWRIFKVYVDVAGIITR